MDSGAANDTSGSTSDSDDSLRARPDPSAFSQMPVLLFIRGLGLMFLAVGLVGGLHYYLGARLIRDGGVPGPWAGLAWVSLALLFFSIPVGFAVSRAGRSPLTLALNWVSHLWIGTFGLLLTAVSATDLLVFLLRKVQPEAAVQAEVWGPAQAAGVLALVVPALAFGFVTARGMARIERVQVKLKGLGPGFDGLRIVQISDIHIGQTLNGKFLKRVVDQVNALDADVVAITGDLVDGQVRHLRVEVAVLEQLKAKRGVFFVTGNHEYYHGGPAWEAELRRLGITVLHNQHQVLKSQGDELVLAGVTDYDGARFGEANASRPEVAFADAPERAPRVLLAHQPRSARAAAMQKVDLQLSGHTHGGQMFPWMFFVRLQQPMIAGLKVLHGVQVYTNRGTGYWGPPIRLGPTPEITELTLRSA